jgi:uncharacterized protein (DUF924 family)
MVSPEEVLELWFGEPARSDGQLLEKVRRWFADGAAMDAEIRERFGATVELAMTGELDHWADTPRGRLALVIVLDQLTRHCFRGTPRPYEADPKAQALALDALDREIDAGMAPIERMFLAMPLHHAETLAHQRRALAHARALAWTAPPALAEIHVEQALKYNDIIERFGRFPHRNAILGRDSTPAELAFLADWPEHAPPRRMRDQAAVDR